ncbi:MAG TPA: protein kinase [Candidatus Dormibacteraeota bacterium]|nr:protein kinase [Candidatus Dormibacteraeota bacterium]
MDLKPGQTLSHYRLVKEIGQGGMGVVFEALDVSLGRHVALKTLPPGVAADGERLRWFQQEARAVAALNHPNIVTIHSVEEADGVHFLTMELIEGATLDASIRRGGMPLGDFFDVAVPLAEALSAAHEKGIVHRDLKPANVMVTREARVKVLDFGLAKLWKQGAPAESEPTRTVRPESGPSGTVPYMSPEQLQGKEPDQRSDIFSLGIILYEMATGERPFKGGSPAEVSSSILRDTPRPIVELRRGLPDLLGRIVRRCLEKDPRRRHQSALDVRNELEELRETADVAGPTGGASRQEPSPAGGDARAGGRRASSYVVAGVAALAVIAIGLALLVRGRSGPPAPRGGASPASIAILPFDNMSDDKENEYFSDGITEELINALVKVKGLNVPARTSVFALKGKKMTVQEIGEKLGVDAVVEGSVRKSGDTLRITAQLINVADGYHLWSESYDRQMKDVFAIQDEISRSIVRALQLTLTPTEQQALQKAPTSDVQAYDYYLRGRKLFYLAGRKNWESARAMFSRAIEIDARYALAYAGVADASAMLYNFADSSEKNLEEARGASAKALELAPDLAEAHASRGNALSLGKSYAEAEQEFETAMRLDPKLYEAPYFYARTCWIEGKLEKAAQLFELAADLRPEDYQSLSLLAVVFNALHRPTDALATHERCLAAIKRQLESNPDDVRAIYMGSSDLLALGRTEEALSWGERALAIDPHDQATLYNVACLYANARRFQKAVDLLEQAVDAGFAQKQWIEHDGDLDPLRNEPRFKALLKRMKK